MVFLPTCLGFGWKIEICCLQCFALHFRIRTGVNLGRFNLHMSKKVSNVMKINVRMEQVHRFGMADNMRSNSFFALHPRNLRHIFI